MEERGRIGSKRGRSRGARHKTHEVVGGERQEWMGVADTGVANL